MEVHGGRKEEKRREGNRDTVEEGRDGGIDMKGEGGLGRVTGSKGRERKGRREGMGRGEGVRGWGREQDAPFRAGNMYTTIKASFY